VMSALAELQLHFGQVANLFGVPPFVLFNDERLNELSETVFNKLMDLAAARND